MSGSTVEIVTAGKVIVGADDCVISGFHFDAHGGIVQDAVICGARWAINRLEEEIRKLEAIKARGQDSDMVDFTAPT